MSGADPDQMLKPAGRQSVGARAPGPADPVDAFALAGLGSRDAFIARLGGRTAVPIGLLLVLVYAFDLDGSMVSVLVPVGGIAIVAFGLALTRWPHLLPLHVLDVLLIGADIALVWISRIGHGIDVAFPGVYLVIGTIVFAMRRWPWALTHMAMLGASYAGVLTFGPDKYAPETRWVCVMVLIATEAAFIRWLVASIVVAATAEHSARTLVEANTIELEKVSRAKTSFLAEMSHELRTPLNAIKGFTDLLRTGLVGTVNEQQQAALQDISDSSQHLVALVDDVLDIANIEAGGIRLVTSDVDVREVLDESLNMLRERATARSIGCGLDVPDGIGSIVADRLKLRQVFVNLLTNAVKFTPAGGYITVRAQRTVPGDGISVAVIDSGPGIPPGQQERIFEKFTYSPDSEGGTGLGLAISRALIESHGGTLTVHDTPGGGSTFRVRLPHHLGATGPSATGAADPAEIVAPDYSSFTEPGSPGNLRLLGSIGSRLTIASGVMIMLAGLLTPLTWNVRLIVLAAGALLVPGGALLRHSTGWLTNNRIEVVRWLGLAAITVVDGIATDLANVVPFTYAWLLMVSVALSDRRRALAELVGAAVGLAVVTVIRHPAYGQLQWVAIVMLLAFNCEIISWITARLRAVIVAEQAAYTAASQVHSQVMTVSGHKSAFVANMSHELRTPLNAIIGFADLLASELIGPLDERQREYVGDVQQAARQLLALINDVLDVARLEAGQLKLAPDVVNLGDLLHCVLARTRVPERDVMIDVWVQPGLDLVVADHERLEQVLVQVVANAVRFTPDGGRVDIRASSTPRGELAVSITDTGVGFSPEEIPHAFEPFRRGARPPADAAPGAGLGLSLVKGLVELHGGRVSVTNNDIGSTVSMSIPALMSVKA